MKVKHSVLFALTTVGAVTPSVAERPNVILIYIDDMGIGDVGCYGGRYTPTPNIDQLAKDGIRFDHYYSAAPVSSPSRTGVMTGMFPIRHKINTYLSDKVHNKNHEQRDFVDLNAPMISREFQKVGYATAHIGKWHMGGGRDVDNAPSILKYGFDYCISTWESTNPDPLLTASNWIWCNDDSIKRWNRTGYFVDKTVEYIQKQAGKPFYINLWPDDVHTPWVPEDLRDNKKEWESEEAFTKVMAETDRQIGRLINALDQMGLSENTLIIFTSDNGPAQSFNNVRGCGLRGQKNSL
ncbi:MAG: sulfatase-like hydrolase/transferase, partial [Bacteroidales bacterium]